MDHMLDERMGPLLISEFDMDYIVVVRLHYLSGVIRNEIQIIINAPAEGKVDEHQRDDLFHLVWFEVHGTAPAIGDAGASKNYRADTFVA